MTIKIYQNICNYESLSDSAKLVLSLIPGGKRWFLDNSNVETTSYAFNSEAEFLGAVLDGIHNTNLIFIHQIGLFADPEKLLGMGSKALRILKRLLRQGKYEQAIEHCAKSDIYSSALMNKVIKKFLSSCGIQNNVLFKVINLEEQIAVYKLANNLEYARYSPKALHKAAAEYAIEKAQSVDEFCDLYCFYLFVSNKLKLKSSDNEVRLLRVKEVFNALTPFANDMLLCPQISGTVGVDEINQAISIWIDQGNNFGYSSIASAVFQLSQNVDLMQLYGSILEREIEKFTGKIRRFLLREPLTQSELSQDGKFLILTNDCIETDVKFSLSQHGCLVLEEFKKLEVSTSRKHLKKVSHG